jgi:hypothetical protein
MFQPNPPAPKAIPDDQLNAKIAELQLQPDGLVAAMALIEEQSRLRQEDALEFSKWQLQAQMHAATAPAPTEPEIFQDPVVFAPPVVPLIAAESIPLPTPMPSVVSAPEVESVSSNSNTTASPERIEDVVAALNASYAEMATEPENPQTPIAQSSSAPEVAQEQSIFTEQEQIVEPEPVASSVAKTPNPSSKTRWRTKKRLLMKMRFLQHEQALL